jgi:hypothetical protein
MFLSSTNPLTLINKKGDEKRPTLLLLKDSFGHSLVPFLALHFNLVVVDLAQYKDIYKKFGSFDIDKALICYNLENVVTANTLGKGGYSYMLIKGWEDKIN